MNAKLLVLALNLLALRQNTYSTLIPKGDLGDKEATGEASLNYLRSRILEWNLRGG
jgi:hypothetical protein